MPYNPTIHRRRSTRWRHHNYATPGSYFVKICTHQRQHLFGEVQNDRMALNDTGQAAQAYWQRLTQHFAHIRLDAYVVMPNHFHGIIQIIEWPDVYGMGDRPHGTSSGLIGAIVGNHKSVSTRQINRLRHTPGNPVWQRNYHDRIIRNQRELDNVRAYIYANPQNWQNDSFR